jgi:hypothetical protein
MRAALQVATANEKALATRTLEVADLKDQLVNSVAAGSRIPELETKIVALETEIQTVRSFVISTNLSSKHKLQLVLRRRSVHMPIWTMAEIGIPSARPPAERKRWTTPMPARRRLVRLDGRGCRRVRAARMQIRVCEGSSILYKSSVRRMGSSRGDARS